MDAINIDWINGIRIFRVIWLSIAKTDEIVTVTGKLEPKGSVQEIQMPLGGIASEILVKEGDSVLAGQVVMRLDTEATQKRFESLKESQKLKRFQLELKQQELYQYLLLNEEEVKTLETNLSLRKRYYRDTKVCLKKVRPQSYVFTAI